MVDPIMADHTGNLILRLKEAFHRTSIVVTHDTHLAKKLADTVVFLQEGKPPSSIPGPPSKIPKIPSFTISACRMNSSPPWT